MSTLIVGHLPFEQSSWIRHENVDDITIPLMQEFGSAYGNRFPSSARLYLERIDKEHDITPLTPMGAEALRKIEGTVYAIVWPEAQALAIQAGVTVGLFLLNFAIQKIFPDEKVTPRKIPQGSPNNLPGDRKNVDRVLQRIPDIYGRVKCTPDLLQYPYISYEGNLQVEINYMCIGRGEFDVSEDDIKEGLTRVNQIPGASVAIYPPGEIPGTGTPQLEVGATITDKLYTVVPIRGITGENLLAPNNNVIWGDEEGDSPNFNGDIEAPLFTYVSTGVGTIKYNKYAIAAGKESSIQDILDNLAVGDKVGLEWKSLPDGGLDQTGAISVHALDLVAGSGGPSNVPNLQLLPETADDEHYEITDITNDSTNVTVELAIPVSVQAEWEKIADWNPVGPGGPYGAPSGSVFNRTSALYTLNYVQGPFFCNDPYMEEIHLNFVAERGLWIDNGRAQRPYGDKLGTDDRGIEIIILVTPTDEDGTPIGPVESFSHRMLGSRINRNFIGQTAKVTPSFSGPFLLSVYRNTLSFVRAEHRSFRRPAGADTVDHPESNWREDQEEFMDTNVPYAQNVTWEDGIRWTHAYSMSTPKRRNSVGDLIDIDDFGNVTTVHSRLAQLRNNAQTNIEKRLNILVDRKIGFWDGDSYDPTPTAVRDGLSAVLDILQDPYMGNYNESQIDFVSIAAAFDAVNTSFQDLNATVFSHTFDGESTSVEEILSAIGESCFVQLYRQGDVMKAIADISRQDASLIFNHRNKLPGTEVRTVSFGTEEDYDGVEVEYSDDVDDQIKLYRIPFTSVAPRNARKIKVAGTRVKTKAAMHAWRSANRLLYQSTTTEFEACDEAALALVRDRVLIADDTRTDTQDGEIVRIDGLTVYTSQEVTVTGGSDYTLFIQDVDGTVQSIAVDSQDTKHSLVLAEAPSGTIVLDPTACIFPKYFLVRNQSTTPRAFHILDRRFKSQGQWNIVASNYTEGYYFNDGIRLYLPFKPSSTRPPVLLFDDRSPYAFDWELGDSPGADVDEDRGTVYLGDTFDDFLLYEDIHVTAGTDYTVSVWANPTESAAVFCEANEVNKFQFFFTSGGTLKVAHDGVVVASQAGAVDEDEWHQYGVTYLDSTGELVLYVDGEPVFTDTVASYGSFDGIKVFHTFKGKADSFRYYRGAKPPEFMLELYQKERL